MFLCDSNWQPTILNCIQTILEFQNEDFHIIERVL